MIFIRKFNRLTKYNYDLNNAYFVTLCTFERKCLFGSIINSETKLNAIGKLVKTEWLNLENQFENIYLDEFVIMPNHLHGIIVCIDIPISKFTGKNSNLGQIIKRFKLESQRKFVAAISGGHSFNPNMDEINPNEFHGKIYGERGFVSTKLWQKSFYDHVIRNEKDLERIREYVYFNPVRWELDELNPGV